MQKKTYLPNLNHIPSKDKKSADGGRLPSLQAICNNLERHPRCVFLASGKPLLKLGMFFNSQPLKKWVPNLVATNSSPRYRWPIEIDDLPIQKISKW